MVGDGAWVSIVPQAGGPGGCELCMAEVAERAYALVVQHPRGGKTALGVCDRCAAAVRRLAAVTGGLAHFTLAQGATSTPMGSKAPGPTTRSRMATVGEPELLYEYADALLASDGVQYTVRVFGEPRADGTWVGWIQFKSARGDVVLSTERETTQSNREHLEYWSRGLERAYLDGALSRAHRAAMAHTRT
jgi:hypothetical protein